MMNFDFYAQISASLVLYGLYRYSQVEEADVSDQSKFIVESDVFNEKNNVWTVWWTQAEGIISDILVSSEDYFSDFVAEVSRFSILRLVMGCLVIIVAAYLISKNTKASRSRTKGLTPEEYNGIARLVRERRPVRSRREQTKLMAGETAHCGSDGEEDMTSALRDRRNNARRFQRTAAENQLHSLLAADENLGKVVESVGVNNSCEENRIDALIGMEELGEEDPKSIEDLDISTYSLESIQDILSPSKPRDLDIGFLETQDDRDIYSEFEDFVRELDYSLRAKLDQKASRGLLDEYDGKLDELTEEEFAGLRKIGSNEKFDGMDLKASLSQESIKRTSDCIKSAAQESDEEVKEGLNLIRRMSVDIPISPKRVVVRRRSERGFGSECGSSTSLVSNIPGSPKTPGSPCIPGSSKILGSLQFPVSLNPVAARTDLIHPTEISKEDATQIIMSVDLTDALAAANPIAVASTESLQVSASARTHKENFLDIQNACQSMSDSEVQPSWRSIYCSPKNRFCCTKTSLKKKISPLKKIPTLMPIEDLKRMIPVPMAPREIVPESYSRIAKRRSPPKHSEPWPLKANAVVIRDVRAMVEDLIENTIAWYEKPPMILLNGLPVEELEQANRKRNYGLIPRILLNGRPHEEDERLRLEVDQPKTSEERPPSDVKPPQNSEKVSPEVKPAESTKENAPNAQARQPKSPKSLSKIPVKSPKKCSGITSPKPAKSSAQTPSPQKAKVANVSMTKTFQMRAEIARTARRSPASPKRERISLK